MDADQECQNTLNEKTEMRITFLERPTNENKKDFIAARNNVRRTIHTTNQESSIEK